MGIVVVRGLVVVVLLLCCLGMVGGVDNGGIEGSREG
jgi:hypothetical protein